MVSIFLFEMGLSLSLELTDSLDWLAGTMDPLVLPPHCQGYGIIIM